MTANSTKPGHGAREVLVQLLRRALAGQQGAQGNPWPRVRDGAEEELLVQAVMRHRLAAFLHPALESDAVCEELPIDFIGLCRQAYFATLRRNLVAMEVGDALLEALAQRGLSAAPRGPWALNYGLDPVHPDPGERPIDQLELMLPAAEEPEVREVARALGFEPRGEARSVWRRLGRMDLALRLRFGEPVAGPHGHLLDAAAALERNHFRRWVGLLDVHRLVDEGDLAPLALELQAARAGLDRALGSSLRLARSVLGTQVPAPWQARARPRRLEDRKIPLAVAPSVPLS